MKKCYISLDNADLLNCRIKCTVEFRECDIPTDNNGLRNYSLDFDIIQACELQPDRDKYVHWI